MRMDKMWIRDACMDVVDEHVDAGHVDDGEWMDDNWPGTMHEDDVNVERIKMYAMQMDLSERAGCIQHF